MNNTECKTKTYNLFINSSNQANLSSIENSSHVQLNAILVFIHPYELEQLDLDEFNIDIRVDDNGAITIGDKTVKAVEIQPGLKILGVIRNSNYQ